MNDVFLRKWSSVSLDVGQLENNFILAFLLCEIPSLSKMTWDVVLEKISNFSHILIFWIIINLKKKCYPVSQKYFF